MNEENLIQDQINEKITNLLNKISQRQKEMVTQLDTFFNAFNEEESNNLKNK